jgi:ATP-binding protein involved in chromosome partitioning
LNCPTAHTWTSSAQAAAKPRAKTGTPFLGKVPMDQNVRIGGDTGKPIIVSHPDSPVAKALREIAESLAAKVSVAALGAKNDVPINIIE